MQKYELLLNTLFTPSLSHHDGHPAALLPFKLKKMVKDKNQIYYYTASIIINAPYTMCYSIGNYIGTLAANCTKTKA